MDLLTFDPDMFVQELMASVRQACQRDVAEIAHVKIALTDASHLLRANATKTSDGADEGTTLQPFNPGYPRPPYRVAAA